MKKNNNNNIYMSQYTSLRYAFLKISKAQSEKKSCTKQFIKCGGKPEKLF